MKNYLIIGTVVIIFLGSIFVFVNKKPPLTKSNNGTGNTESEEETKTGIFENLTDMCSTLSKQQVSELIGKTVIKTESHTSGTLHSCQYYLNETQAITINNDMLNVEGQKKGHEILGRKIITNPKIPMEHFLVVQENGLINEIYLVMGTDNYVSINRTSTKTLTEEEVVDFAAKLAAVVTGKTPLLKTDVSSPTAAETNNQGTVPLPLDTDIVRSFISAIEIGRPSDAVSYMNVADDSEKQAWAVQFNAITSLKLINIEPSNQNEWTETRHSFKVTLDVQMNPDSANAPIPYYGWDNGQNIRWITLEKVGKMWRISQIATGP